MDSKISCIIPYHNNEKELLLECVNSILQQDFEDYELLIVDDGSDEEHAACLEEIRGLDDRIRILTQPARGAAAARNTGVREAQGKYVAFVDADDLVVPYFFSEAYRVASENQAEYVVGGERFTPDRTATFPRDKDPEIKEWDPAKYRLAVIMVTERMPDGGFFGRGPVARLIRRDVAMQVPFPEGMTLGEDVIWNLDVIAGCSNVYMVYQIWYLYWRNLDSASNKYNENVIPESEHHLNELAKRINWEDEKEAETYFLHAYEFLRRHVFGCYLGRKECPLPLRERARMFRALLKREPWNLYESHMDPKACDRRTRGKYRLVHSGLLFRFWYFRNRVRRSGRDTE